MDRGYGSGGARAFLWRAQSFPLAAPALAAPEEFLWRRQTAPLWRRQSVSLAAPAGPALAAPEPTPLAAPNGSPLAVPEPGMRQQNGSLPAPETAPLWRLQRNSSGGARGPPSRDARGIPLAAPNELPLVAPEGSPLAAPEEYLWRRQHRRRARNRGPITDSREQGTDGGEPPTEHREQMTDSR